MTHFASDDAPFLFIHGREDLVVPLSQSRALHDRLRDAGVASSLVVVENAGHGLTPVNGDPSPDRAELVRRALEFLRNELDL